jgi:hypothetical protein
MTVAEPPMASGNGHAHSRPPSARSPRKQDILAHAWIGLSSMVICTSDSRLMITNGGDVVYDMSYADPDKDLPNPPYITNVASFAGSILATLGTGNVIMLERADEENLFKKLKEFALEPSEPNALAVSPDGDHAVCTMRNGRLYSFGTSSDPGKVCGGMGRLLRF